VDTADGRIPDFCASYQATCVDASLATPYTDCEAEAEAFEVGDQSDTTGNTLGCRIYHMDAAQPLANIDIGLDVDLFCTTYDETCAVPSLGTAYTDCAAEAAAFEVGNEDEFSGNTLACRSYHLEVAFQQEPEVHCPHASPDGGGVCQ
jgi:hypothetical protein